MPQPKIEQIGSVRIDGKFYRLVRLEGRQQSYVQGFEDEPPWSGGVPSMVSEPTFTWHQGGFKSRQGIPGTSEYGINSDARWPFRLVPGPKINTLALAESTAPVTHMAAVYGGIFTDDVTYALTDPAQLIVAGTRLYLITSLGSDLLIYQHATIKPKMTVHWQGGVYMVTTTGLILKLNGIPSTSALEPSGAGTTAQWTPSAGANYENVDDAHGSPDDDSTYNSSSTAGHIDLFTLPSTGYHAGAVPTPLWFIRYRRTTTGGTDPVIRPVMRVGGVNYFGDPITLENDTNFHEVSVSDFETNPDGDIAWTVAALEAAEIGYELQTAPDSGVVRVTQCNLIEAGHNWETDDAVADWLAVGPKRLFKVRAASQTVTLKNIDPGLDPTDESDWADDVIVPGVTLAGNVPLVAFETTALVATNHGVHAVDEDGTGIRVMDRISEAIKFMTVVDPYVMVSHNHGLSRWIPGFAESCGLEKEIMNQSPVRGPLLALASLGKWLFGVVNPPSGNTHIIVGRDRDASEAALGPVIWDTLIETGEDVEYQCLLAGLSWAGYFLAFPLGNNIGYCIFPVSGGAPEIDSSAYRFATSATRYSAKYRFTDWHDKDFPKVDVVGEGLTEDIYWSVAYSIDGGAWQTTDIDGNAMNVQADGRQTFFLPTSAKGREIQFRFTYTSNDDTAGGALTFFEPFCVPQSRKIPIVVMHLVLEEGIRHDEGIEHRSAAEQFSDLIALLESAAAVATRGPWSLSADVNVWLRRVRLVETIQEGHTEPAFLVEVAMQLREAA